MTALQNVLTAMEITGVKVQNKKVRALELLEKVGLTEVETKRLAIKWRVTTTCSNCSSAIL
ncbi:ABC-transporter (plasmid) [Bacillus thuringiensis MC28]|nr:ABC-transporter [Bacillus thuringiensis MC28]